MSYQSPAPESVDFNPRKYYVRITGKRHGFIEFEFAIGEPEVFVEMVLREAAYKDFCARYNVTLLPTRPASQEDIPTDMNQEWRLSDATNFAHTKSHAAPSIPTSSNQKKNTSYAD